MVLKRFAVKNKKYGFSLSVMKCVKNKNARIVFKSKFFSNSSYFLRLQLAKCLKYLNFTNVVISNKHNFLTFGLFSFPHVHLLYRQKNFTDKLFFGLVFMKI